MKALMWMKEETLGVEDCFKLTKDVMDLFARSEIESSDSTVELYLLNFWTKDLSTRDLSDRISICSHDSDARDQARDTGYSISMMENASAKQLKFFNCLLKWFSEKKLFPADEDQEGFEEWAITDLRKIVLFLTYSVLEKGNNNSNDISRLFIGKSVAKYGVEKVKEFFEIQLMHHNQLSL